jgi:hypothetical protein
LIQEGLVLG